MDTRLRNRWDRASTLYQWTTWGDDHRFSSAKDELFANMHGRCMMVAAGTGNDFRYFPAGLEITAIDISPRMLERAQPQAAKYRGDLKLEAMDVRNLDSFEDERFDTVVTSCTFCSVPDPVSGLKELHRCLKPGGKLLMFEHVRSRLFPLGLMQDLMTLVTKHFGPDMNRPTVANVVKAGFRIRRETNVYLDIVKAIEAERPAASPNENR